MRRRRSSRTLRKIIYDHQDEIDREISENTEEAGRLRLASQMRSEKDYRKITGQRE